MISHIKNLSRNITFLTVLLLLAFLNWSLPLYRWFGDTPLVRFIWLGIFFVILDIIFEVLTRSLKQMKLMMEISGFAKDLHKISGEFHVVSKFTFANGVQTDHIVVGSSGVWMITVKDDEGKIIFNGDDLIQGGVILTGLITRSLEKSYGLASYLKQKVGRDIKVAPVIAFSSLRADLTEMPKSVRGVFISSRKDAVSLVENTDFQLIDKKTIEEIYNILSKK